MTLNLAVLYNCEVTSETADVSVDVDFQTMLTIEDLQTAHEWTSHNAQFITRPCTFIV
jgi:hypothetical protein